MGKSAFDFNLFCLHVGASPKEAAPIRQDLVRGLKDYFEFTYGYDRYGAETVLLLPDRMAQPNIYGFALLRLLHDRRLHEPTKVGSARQALDMIDYGADGGLPHGILAAVNYLAHHDHLDATDLRYVLVASAGENEPLGALGRIEALVFFNYLLSREELPAAERLFWGHSLIARHRDQQGATDLINALLGSTDLPVEGRQELARAWLNWRQPRLDVPTPTPDLGFRSVFVAEHLPFWVAHAPSWPTLKMVHQALVWLARLGDDPLELAEAYIGYHGNYAEQIHAAVADIIQEHAGEMTEAQAKAVIERGITISGSSPTRRRFYRLGTDLFGDVYLTRATTDAANSVRQWAARQLEKQS